MLPRKIIKVIYMYKKIKLNIYVGFLLLGRWFFEISVFIEHAGSSEMKAVLEQTQLPKKAALFSRSFYAWEMAYLKTVQ